MWLRPAITRPHRISSGNHLRDHAAMALVGHRPARRRLEHLPEAVLGRGGIKSDGAGFHAAILAKLAKSRQSGRSLQPIRGREGRFTLRKI